MPQVAQQDYLKIVPKYPRTIEQDAAALAQLRGVIDRGTFWDALIQYQADDDTSPYLGRVLGFDGYSVAVYDYVDNEVKNIVPAYNQAQYECLAAVQAQIDEMEGRITRQVPVLACSSDTTEQNWLEFLSDESSYWITIGGKQVIALMQNGQLAGYETTNGSIDAQHTIEMTPDELDLFLGTRLVID